MTDPHDGVDATWITHQKNVVMCPACQEEAETCRCSRVYPAGASIILAAVVSAMLVLLMVSVALIMFYGSP